MDKIKSFTQKYSFVLLLTIITFAAGVRIYHVCQKEAFHIDEILSFQIINGTSNLRCRDFDQKYKYKWIYGKELIDDYFTIREQNLKKDLQVLLRDTKDPSHPNLYFVALRLLLFNGTRGVDGSFKLYGIGLNIFFHCIGIFLLYLLYDHIYKTEAYALLAVFLYSTSIGAISTSLFIRMYELLSLSIILTILTVLKLLDKEKPRILDFVLLSLVSTLGYLSHYYYIIFVIILTPLILYHCLNYKQSRLIFAYVIAFVQGFITAQALYPQFIRGLLTSFRAKEAYSKVDMSVLINQLDTTARVTYDVIDKNVIYFLPLVALSILILTSYSVLKKRKTIVNSKEISLALISLGLSFVLMYISPFKAPRYLFCIFPILVVLTIMSIRLVPSRNAKYIIVAVVCIVYIIKSLDVSNKHFVYQGYKNKLIFREMPSAPVYFLNPSRWGHGIVSAHFVENQKYKLILDEEPVLDFSETGSKQIFLIITGHSQPDVVKKHIKNGNWVIKEEVNYGSFIILGIERANFL